MAEHAESIQQVLVRTYRTTTVVAVVVVLWIWAYVDARGAAIFSLGVPLGMLLLAAVSFQVHRMGPSRGSIGKGKFAFVGVAVGKFALAGLVMYLVSRWSPAQLPYVAAGYSLPVAVLVLKMLGTGLNRHVDAEPVAGSGGNCSGRRVGE